VGKFLQMRTIHRVVSIFIVVVTLYLGATGTLIEAIDFRTIATDPSPLDPNLMAMREDFAGPPNFRVLGAADHLLEPLPADADLGAMLATVIKETRASLGDAPLKFVELRMAADRPVGQVKSGRDELRFDATSGAALGAPPPELNEDQPPASQRNTIKHLHRMTTFGDKALWINIVAAVSLATLVVTGLVMYGRMLLARGRAGRKGLFWKSGDWWRTLHLAISASAAIFLSIVVLSGSWLALESLMFGKYLASHRTVLPSGRSAPGTLAIDASSPLNDSALPGMLSATLAAYHSALPGVPLRVVRLRNYGGMGQGVAISDGHEAHQLVFDTATGKRQSLTEPGYPPTGFPFGWQAHQYAKSIHRGDFFGLTGRFMSLLAGLAMTYLSISGVVMYWRMWRKRRSQGRKGLIWA
jgi:uncharacterized iron-regulated membrane protein